MQKGHCAVQILARRVSINTMFMQRGCQVAIYIGNEFGTLLVPPESVGDVGPGLLTTWVLVSVYVHSTCDPFLHDLTWMY